MRHVACPRNGAPLQGSTPSLHRNIALQGDAVAQADRMRSEFPASPSRLQRPNREVIPRTFLTKEAVFQSVFRP